MSVLRGMAAGLGEGMMATGRLFGEAALNEQRAALELEKTKAVEQFRIDQRNLERQRIGGIVATARGSAIEQAHAGDDPFGPNPSAAAYDRLGDRAAVKALTESGDVESAAALDKMSETGSKVVQWGNTYVDADGNVIYDNASTLKGALQKQTADAKTAAVDVKGKPKPINQEQIDRITSQVDKIVTNNLGGVKNPFAMPGEDVKTAADTAKQNLMSTALSKMAVNAAQSGTTLNPSEGFSQLKTVVDKYDQKVTADARAYGAKFFDEKGRLKEGALAAMQKANVPEMAMQDKMSFQRWYRDTQLIDVDGFNTFRKGNKEGSKPSAEPEKKPSAESKPAPKTDPVPAPAPEKRSIVASARNADSFGSNFSERQKTLVERERQADADPELQRLLDQKNKALRDNKPVLANNALAQYNTLRKERYGL